ncbi:MAG: DNA repair protein RadC [Deltaproteobacteria bacterium]|nr:DNA repair protein RadC [Deltaproteobacteria bacterium]
MPDAPHPGAGHRARLRDKFLAHGLEKFTDAEILELLLTLATPRQDCKERARQLLAKFGGLAAVLEAPAPELAREPGLGPKNVLGLKLVPAVARRYLEDRLAAGPGPLEPASLLEWLTMSMQALSREVCRVILLDAAGGVLAWEEIFAGTYNEAAVYPREVVALALSRGAAGLIFVHNHPSGDPTPSPDDRRLTRRLFHACRGVGLDMADHYIIARGGAYSFAQAGELAGWRQETAALGLEDGAA